jgi:hypothetical protein
VADIFLCYASQDRETAKSLAEAISNEGWLVWWDRKIPLGRRFDVVIAEELAAARCVIVLWSKDSCVSQWVVEEARDGLERGALIPVLIEAVRPPIGFRSIQTADLSKWMGNSTDMAFQQLLSEISSFFSRQPSASQASETVSQPHRTFKESAAESRKVEEERQAAEARRKAQEERQTAEARRKADEERLAAEARRNAEEELHVLFNNKDLLGATTSKEPSMITDGLHCRLLALTRVDFDSVAQAARQFGKPITTFDRRRSVVAWDEFFSFQDGEWSWAAGIPATTVKLRIAVFQLGSLPEGVGVFGVISGFSSLSNAARNYIMRPFIDELAPLQVNLRSIVDDPHLQTALVGYSYEIGGIFHTVYDLSHDDTALAKVKLRRSHSSTLHSVRLKSASALVDVYESSDISLTAEAGEPEYAIEDAQQVFAMIHGHTSIGQTFTPPKNAATRRCRAQKSAMSVDISCATTKCSLPTYDTAHHITEIANYRVSSLHQVEICSVALAGLVNFNGGGTKSITRYGIIGSRSAAPTESIKLSPFGGHGTEVIQTTIELYDATQRVGNNMFKGPKESYSVEYEMDLI